MTKISDIINYMEEIAPPSYQESYDNSKLIVGDAQNEITGTLITLDVTEKVIEEAIEKNCNLVVAHHPIIFKGLKKLTGSNYVERTIIKAIKNDIAIFSIHTNLDNVAIGVNKKIADKLSLSNVSILAPKNNLLSKLITFTPHEATDKVLRGINEAGAGQIGNYNNCAFYSDGIGQFQPNEYATPSIGKKHKLETVKEHRIEVVFPKYKQKAILGALKENHPYEEIAYYLQDIQNENQEVGSGIIGTTEQPIEEELFLGFLKERMDLTCIKHTKFLNKKVNKVAICGGSGSFLLQNAIKEKADIFITSDFKYHEFFDAEEKLIIADIGHYESEVFTKELIYELLSKKFSNFVLYLSEVITNPISYLY